MSYELIVVGGGPAGLAAAYEAYNNGIKKILIIERDKELGGILNQCIHNGFGLHTFKEELTEEENSHYELNAKYLNPVNTISNFAEMQYLKEYIRQSEVKLTTSFDMEELNRTLFRNYPIDVVFLNE